MRIFFVHRWTPICTDWEWIERSRPDHLASHISPTAKFPFGPLHSSFFISRFSFLIFRFSFFIFHVSFFMSHSSFLILHVSFFISHSSCLILHFSCPYFAALAIRPVKISAHRRNKSLAPSEKEPYKSRVHGGAQRLRSTTFYPECRRHPPRLNPQIHIMDGVTLDKTLSVRMNEETI